MSDVSPDHAFIELRMKSGILVRRTLPLTMYEQAWDRGSLITDVLDGALAEARAAEADNP